MTPAALRLPPSPLSPAHTPPWVAQRGAGPQAASSFTPAGAGETPSEMREHVLTTPADVRLASLRWRKAGEDRRDA